MGRPPKKKAYPDQYTGGRPKKVNIDWKAVENALMAGCNGTEIASFVGLHRETFYDRVVKEQGMSFTEFAEKFRSKGDLFLRQKQYHVAMQGDRSMMIWLGKQRLGQKENHQDDKPPNDSVLNEFLEFIKSKNAQSKTD